MEGKEWDSIDSDGIADANLAGKLSILGSASVIKKCALVIGNDGGLMHVAGAVGCPLVAVMANTPISYRPPGENTTVIHSKLGCCNGIYPNRPKDCSSPKCTEAIKIKEVYEACIERLSKLNDNSNHYVYSQHKKTKTCCTDVLNTKIIAKDNSL